MSNVIDFDPIGTLRAKSLAHAALVVALGTSRGGMVTKTALADHVMAELWEAGFMIVPRERGSSGDVA